MYTPIHSYTYELSYADILATHFRFRIKNELVIFSLLIGFFGEIYYAGWVEGFWKGLLIDTGIAMLAFVYCLIIHRSYWGFEEQLQINLYQDYFLIQSSHHQFKVRWCEVRDIQYKEFSTLIKLYYSDEIIIIVHDEDQKEDRTKFQEVIKTLYQQDLIYRSIRRVKPYYS